MLMNPMQQGARMQHTKGFPLLPRDLSAGKHDTTGVLDRSCLENRYVSPYCRRRNHVTADAGRTAVSALSARALPPSPPHAHGAPHPLPLTPTRKYPLSHERLLLPAEGLGRLHHLRGNADLATGARLRMDTRHTHTRPGGRLATGHRGGT